MSLQRKRYFWLQGIRFQLSQLSLELWKPRFAESIQAPSHLHVYQESLTQWPQQVLANGLIVLQNNPKSGLASSCLAIETPVSFLGFCFFLKELYLLYLLRWLFVEKCLNFTPGKFFGGYLPVLYDAVWSPLVLILLHSKKSWMATWMGEWKRLVSLPLML